jgi:hypothetical protein
VGLVGWTSRQRKDVAALIGVLALFAPVGAVPASAARIPNDPSFSLQWGDENTGQAIPEQPPGVPGADDSATAAWSVSTGSRSIVIAETDTGVNYELPDLAGNIWTNTAGVLGCLPTTHGFDVLNASGPAHCLPNDTDKTYGGHGTHVAGIIGALGGNGIGVAGVNWETTILPVRWLEDANEPTPPQEVLAKALELIVKLKERNVNVRVVNDSPTFRGNGKEEAKLHDEIEELGQHGILFVTAAGNGGTNDDTEPFYPCDYHLPNEICVTASNDRDELASFANWGPSHVDLAAPGAGIYSTLRNGEFGYLSGGSMAAAQVSGAAGLILSANPSLTPEQLKADILSHVDRMPAFEGKVASGGRLDVCKAMPGCTEENQPPAAPPPAGPPPPPPPVPVLNALRLTPSSFKAARSGASISSTHLKPGTFVTYRDTQASATELTVLEPRSGVLSSAKHCVAPPRKPSTHAHRAKSCVRYVRVGGFWRLDGAGLNRFHFSGRLGRSRLSPGRYRLQAVPVFGGVRGPGATANFRIIS